MSCHISFILILWVVYLIQDSLILDQLWSTLVHTVLRVLDNYHVLCQINSIVHKFSDNFCIRRWTAYPHKIVFIHHAYLIFGNEIIQLISKTKRRTLSFVFFLGSASPNTTKYNIIEFLRCNRKSSWIVIRYKSIIKSS